VLALNARGASFFTEARIRRFGDRATGWFTDIYPEPLTLASNPGVSINQTQWEADCTNGALRLVYGAFYRADGSPIAQRSLDTSTPEQQRPGTLGALRLDALCGRPVQLYTNQILQTDVLGLRNAYRAQLASSGAGAPPAQASGAGPAPASGSGVRAPGLGAAAWKVLYLNPVLAGFYTPATIRRSGGRASGWITEIFAKPQQGDGQIRDVSIRQSLQEADCAAGTLRSIYAAFYRADGGLIAASPTGSLPPQKPQPGSIGALNMDALCGRPIQLYSDQPLEMSVLDLKNVYATKLTLDRVGGTQGQGSATPAARPPSASPASAAAAQMPAPGMKVATWKFLDGYDDRGVAFIPAQVRRVPGGGQGWMMEVYRKPVNMPSVQLRNVGIDQFLYSADCAQNTLTNAARVFYSPTGAQLASLGGLGTVRPQPGSAAADFLNILCGRPQALWEDDPHTVGALELRQLYIVTLQIQDAVDGK
jgi:hypothetical protein